MTLCKYVYLIESDLYLDKIKYSLIFLMTKTTNKIYYILALF